MISDNPAGRLAAMFVAIAKVSTATSISKIWAEAFEYEVENFEAAKRYRLEAALLLNATELQADALRSDPAVADGINAAMINSQHWAKTIFGWRQNDSDSQNYVGYKLIDVDALVALHQISHAYHYAVPEVMPKSGNIALVETYLGSAEKKLREVLDNLASNEDVPPPMRLRWSTILNDALTAVIFVRFRGYEAVARTLNAATSEISSEVENVPVLSAAPTEGSLSRMKAGVLELSRIANELARNLAVPAGIAYIMASQDFVGGGAIIASGIRYSELLNYRAGRVVEQTKPSKELESGPG